jgi:hypothetical protein
VFVPAAPQASADGGEVSGVQLEFPVASGPGATTTPIPVGVSVGGGVAVEGPGTARK